MPRQVLYLPFGGGIDEKTSERWLEPGQSKTAINVVSTDRGAFVKRGGSLHLSPTTFGGGSFSGAQRLLTYRDELLLYSGDQLYSWSPTLNVWLTKDYAPGLIFSRKSVAQSAQHFSDADVAETANKRVFVWIANNGPAGGTPGTGNVYACIVDVQTGTQIMPATALTTIGTFTAVHVFMSGGNVVVLYAEQVTGSIRVRMIDFSNPVAWTTEVAIVTDMRLIGTWPQRLFGAAPIGLPSNGEFVVAYENNVNRLAVKRFSSVAPGIPLTSVLCTTTLTKISGISCKCGTSPLIWVSFGALNGAGAEVRVAGFNPTTLVETIAPIPIFVSASSTANPVATGVEYIDASHLVCVWNTPGAVMNYRQFTDVGATIGPVRYNWSVFANTNPFTVTAAGVTRMYVGGIVNMSTQERTIFVDLDVTPGDTVTATPARLASSVTAIAAGTLLPLRTFTLASVVFSGTDIITVGSITTLFSRDANNVGKLGLVEVKGDSTFSQCMAGEEAGETLYLSGGVLGTYDGSYVVESGFMYAPGPHLDGSGYGVAVAPGGGLSAGTYQVCFCYEWTSPRGEIHRSPPSIPLTIVAAAGQKLQCTVATQTITLKQDFGAPEIGIIEYRTQANSDVFYRVTPDSLPATNANILTGNALNFDDTTTDSAIATASLLYTTERFLESVAPPGGALLNIYRNRLCAGGGDDPKDTWYSKLLTYGEIAQFHPNQRIPIYEGREVTAQKTLDDTDIFFKDDRAFALVGDGPSDTGEGTDYVVRKITSDVGCIESRSVVVMPDGIMFLSVQGIMLLDRSLQVQPIGQPVQKTIATYPKCTSAVLVAQKNLVRFTFAKTDLSAGVGVWFDYVQKIWTIHDFFSSNYGNLTPAAHAVLWNKPGTNGVYVWVTPGGHTFIEDDSTGLENSTYISMSTETANIRPAGVQAFHRFRRVQILMDKVDNHDLRLEVAYDGSPTYTETVTWTAAELNALSRAEVQYRLTRPRAEAVRFRLTELTPTGGPGIGNARGPIWEALALEWVAKSGPARLSNGARK